MKKYFALFLFVASLNSCFAQSGVFLCVDERGNKEYKNSGGTKGCRPVNLPGITSLNWVEIISGNGETTYIDKDNFSISKNQRKVWVMTSYDAVQEYGFGKYLSVKSLMLFKCDQKEIGRLQTINYSGANGYGDVVASSKKDLKDAGFADVVPNTVGETMLKKVCAYKK